MIGNSAVSGALAQIYEQHGMSKGSAVQWPWGHKRLRPGDKVEVPGGAFGEPGAEDVPLPESGVTIEPSEEEEVAPRFTLEEAPEEQLTFMLEEEPQYVLPTDSTDYSRFLGGKPAESPYEQGERVLAPRRLGEEPELPATVQSIQWSDGTNEWIVFFELDDYPGRIFHVPSSNLSMMFGPDEEFRSVKPKWWK